MPLPVGNSTFQSRITPPLTFVRRAIGWLASSGKLSFVELGVLVDVEVAHLLLLGLAGDQGGRLHSFAGQFVDGDPAKFSGARRGREPASATGESWYIGGIATRGG
jgi:hypothetical protein